MVRNCRQIHFGIEYQASQDPVFLKGHAYQTKNYIIIDTQYKSIMIHVTRD